MPSAGSRSSPTKKKDVYERRTHRFGRHAVGAQQRPIRFVSLQVIAGSKGPQQADLELEIDGKAVGARATATGPVDATSRPSRPLFPHEARLQLFQVTAVTAGTDAQAEVTVRLGRRARPSMPGRRYDTLVASCKAYITPWTSFW